jgi:hypothetical protein
VTNKFFKYLICCPVISLVILFVRKIWSIVIFSVTLLHCNGYSWLSLKWIFQWKKYILYLLIVFILNTIYGSIRVIHFNNIPVQVQIKYKLKCWPYFLGTLLLYEYHRCTLSSYATCFGLFKNGKTGNECASCC